MDKSGITTLVGFSLSGEKRERKKTKKSTHIQVTYYYMVCILQFRSCGDRTNDYGRNSYWCQFFFSMLPADIPPHLFE